MRLAYVIAVPTSFIDLAYRLLGASVGAALAVLLAIGLGSSRHAAGGVGPVDSALIALTIATARELAVCLLELGKLRTERKHILGLLADTRATLKRAQVSSAPLPYRALSDMVAASCLRSRIRTQDFAALEHTLTEVRAYASQYCELLPRDAERLALQMQTIMQKITGDRR